MNELSEYVINAFNTAKEVEGDKDELIIKLIAASFFCTYVGHKSGIDRNTVINELTSLEFKFRDIINANTEGFDIN